MTKSLRKSIQRCLSTAAALAAPLMILPTATLAADPEEEAESEDSSGIEVIYVTSQLREEAIQSVPLSVTALSGGLLTPVSSTQIADPRVELWPDGGEYALGNSGCPDRGHFGERSADHFLLQRRHLSLGHLANERTNG